MDLTGEVIENTHQLKKLDRNEVLKKKRLYWFGRRFQDIFFSGLALIILSPILLLTALVVYIDDPHGSPIFSQIRCGRDNKPFKIYKFRSIQYDIIIQSLIKRVCFSFCYFVCFDNFDNFVNFITHVNISLYYKVVVFNVPLQGQYAILFRDTVDQ